MSTRSTRTAARGATTPRPFDSRVRSCDNRGVKLRTLALAVLLAAGGCEKSSDLTPMQQEASGMLESYTAELEYLQRLHGQLAQRASRLSSHAEASAAKMRLDEAGAKLAAVRAHLTQVPAQINNATTTGAKPAGEARLGLQRTIDRMRTTVVRQTTEAFAALSAVETWIANAERTASAAPAKAAPAADVPPPAGTPAPMTPPSTPPG